ncbi:MAG: hypothetical protein ACFFDP_03910 [Promethearchaeota archaeon]
MKRDEAERLQRELSTPQFAHWIRKLEVREDLSGEAYVVFYTDCLTSMRIIDLEKIAQAFGVFWRAESSRTEQAIFVRLWERS